MKRTIWPALLLLLAACSPERHWRIQGPADFTIVTPPVTVTGRVEEGGYIDSHNDPLLHPPGEEPNGDDPPEPD